MTAQTHNLKRLPLDQVPLKSLRELEYLLGVNRATLLRLADWEKHYVPFQQAKAPKPHTKRISPVKLRDIDNPKDELKQVQSRILKRLLLPIKVPGFLFGAVPEKCVGRHAKAHLGAKLVVKMDIKSYYPNVTNKHVYSVWARVLGCSPDVAKLLTRLTTCDFHLPQGAPTSPALANLFLASIYGPVLAACSRTSVVVTVWVDDLTFSGENAREVIETVRQTLADHGFKDSRKKRVILSTESRKLITGVRLGRDEIRACPLKMREVRAGIHNLSLGRYTDRGRIKDIQSLKGKIAHIRSLCLKDALRLDQQLSAAMQKRSEVSYFAMAQAAEEGARLSR